LAIEGQEKASFSMSECRTKGKKINKSCKAESNKKEHQSEDEKTTPTESRIKTEERENNSPRVNDKQYIVVVHLEEMQ
jgi:hypothetical protein